jgi:hypothetical protein
MAMQNYELSNGTSFLGTCTCGSCRKALKDANGNVDHGQRWSEKRGTYTTRRGPDGFACEIAAKRAR